MKYKHIIFLLCISFGFSQTKIPNISSVEYFKLIDMIDDGGPNQFDLADFPEVIKNIKIDNCDDLVLSLIDLKEKSKKWKNCDSCSFWDIGGDRILNKIKYSINGFSDSIYFNYNESIKAIYDINNKTAFQQKNNELLNVLSKNPKVYNFFKFDLEKIYYGYKFSCDTIKSIEIQVLNKEVLNEKVNVFTELYLDFEVFSIEKTKWNNFKPLYNAEISKNHTYYFNFDIEENIESLKIKRNYPIEEYKFGDNFNIIGIRIGDNEEKLIKQFPNSTMYINEIKEFYRNNDGTYSILLKIEERKYSSVEFILEKGIIKEVNINF